jgi:hypothetical protein
MTSAIRVSEFTGDEGRIVRVMSYLYDLKIKLKENCRYGRVLDYRVGKFMYTPHQNNSD